MEKIDWVALAAAVGNIAPDGDYWRDKGGMGPHESGGTSYAQRALEKIIGTENIRNAVKFIVEGGGLGSELAANVLMHIASLEALEMAYQYYKTGSRELAPYAVDLIQRINDRHSIQWLNEFLHDESPMIIAQGFSMLEQLVWSHRLDLYDTRIDTWLAYGQSHDVSEVRERARDVRRVIENFRQEDHHPL